MVFNLPLCKTPSACWVSEWSALELTSNSTTSSQRRTRSDSRRRKANNAVSANSTRNLLFTYDFLCEHVLRCPQHPHPRPGTQRGLLTNPPRMIAVHLPVPIGLSRGEHKVHLTHHTHPTWAPRFKVAGQHLGGASRENCGLRENCVVHHRHVSHAALWLAASFQRQP